MRTFPQAGYSVAKAPAQIGLEFDEPVTVQSLSLDGESRGRIATSRPSRSADRTTITVSADRPLPDGTYTVRWRITAADGDVVDGTFGFGVGVPTTAADASSAETAGKATT
ncbi:MAG TPA: copper resistance CopC family protein, partial [Mycobacterium sp.]|nr:copper resistance CopC family protein [Mycobacterium sp.]